MTVAQVFQKSIQLSVSATEAYQWHARSGALDRLIPPWENVSIVRKSNGITPGSIVEMDVVTPIGKKRWIAEHAELDRLDEHPVGSLGFVDFARKSPFASWRHEHLFSPVDNNHCEMSDKILFDMPLKAVGGNIGAGIVQDKLSSMFAYRHTVTANDLSRHNRFHELPRKRILISGGTGLVGQVLRAFLTTGGHEVVILTRRKTVDDGSQIEWSPSSGKLDANQLEGFDAVIHLAGANLAEKRWTTQFKNLIRDSRVDSTQLLASKLAELEHKPEVLISASATGFYGDRGDEVLDEKSSAGKNFVASVGQEWEDAANSARQAGIRVVHPRLGVVLTPQGGGLEKMLTPFKLGAGGPLGSGKQFWSWIAIDDVIYAIHELMMNTDISGPVNLVAPRAARVSDFTTTLGRVLSRPALIPAPSFALKAMLGHMADELLLASVNCIPRTLIDAGFTFSFPGLEDALRHVLGKQEA